MTVTPIPPRLSSTILLLRDGPTLEVLMVARHYQIDFAAGALVFPGGKVVDDDRSETWLSTIDGTGYDAREQTARIAAIRETFEETGLLLARHKVDRGPDGRLVGADIADELAPFRTTVDRGEMAFSHLIQEHDLVLALDQLVHFGHWVTPEMMPKRFDTHFFVAPAPEHQVPCHDGRETTDAIWVAPANALDMAKAGKATIIFPTRMNLQKLSLAQSVDVALARFADMPVVRVEPVLEQDEDGAPCLRIPVVEGYGQTLEPLENVKV